MQKIKELHKQLKNVRKEYDFKKSVEVVFVPQHKEGFGVIAVKPDVKLPVNLGKYGELYRGVGVILVEQDSNPYEFLPYKQMNKLFKDIKESSPQSYEDSYLLIRELDGTVSIVTQVAVTKTQLGFMCQPLLVEESE